MALLRVSGGSVTVNSTSGMEWCYNGPQPRCSNLVGDSWGSEMVCRECGSDSLTNLRGEITASLPGFEDAKATPVYFTQEMWVCLSCGFAGVRMPAAQLEVLKQKKRVAS